MNEKTPHRIREYIEEVSSHLFLDPGKEMRVLGELGSHFKEKMSELEELGQGEDDAARSAIRSFGRARVFARLMNEAHGQSTWTEVAIAVLPHLGIASLFSLHLWRHPVLAPMVFLSIVAVTLFGWWRGKPNWLYSWIGYSLFPLLVAGYQTRHFLIQTLAYILRGEGKLLSPWILLPLFVFYGLSLFLIMSTTVRVVRRDWILATLMLVPLSILGIWLYNIEEVGGLFQKTNDVVFFWDPALAKVLAVLGAASALFMRLRQRILKIVALLTVGTMTGAMVVQNIWGNVGYFWLLMISVILLLFLLSPALLRLGLGHKRETGWKSTYSHPR